MSIPLIQKPDKDDINTSIIAIKRNIERINMLLGLSNSEEIDTSKFATKEELQQAVTDLQPVDEVAVDNMHSVTSNAVANAVKTITLWSGDCHTPSQELVLNDNISNYKLLLVYGNVIPSRSPDYDIFCGAFIGGLQNILEGDIPYSLNSNYGSNFSIHKLSETVLQCRRWERYPSSSGTEYTPGICRIVGVLK